MLTSQPSLCKLEIEVVRLSEDICRCAQASRGSRRRPLGAFEMLMDGALFAAFFETQTPGHVVHRFVSTYERIQC